MMRRLSDLSAEINGGGPGAPPWLGGQHPHSRSSQFEANADEVLVLTGDGVELGGIVCPTRKKAKDGPSGARLCLKRSLALTISALWGRP